MKTYVVQHLEGSNSLYDCGYFEAIEEEIKALSYLIGGEGNYTKESLRAEIEESMHEYTHDEVLQAHKEGYGWPEELAIIDEDPEII